MTTTMSKQNLVVDELLTKPSEVCPTLFVGLGGCGCRIVKRIAQHLRRRPDYDDRYRELVKVALVDTNVNDLESYREIADETFLISDFEKEEYSDLASGKMFLEPDDFFTQWVPPDYRFRAGDTAGAGQIRIESRLGVFYQMKHKSFVAKFRKLLEELKSHEHGHRRLDSAEIRIVLCYSVAGGTGSGCHLPVAYMLRDQARELGRPFVVGVAVLPAVFEDKTGINKDGTFANGYAALKEVEHLMKLGSPDSRFFPPEGLDFHYDPSASARRKVREKPFEFVYVVDKPESFTVSDPVDAAADGLYLQFFSPLYSHQASDYDNYTQHQRFLVPHDFEGKGIPGFTSFYGSYGAAVLLVPVEGLVTYCSRAAALSLMRSSFLRSIPSDPIYTLRRNNPAPFFEVTLNDVEHEKAIHVSELHKKEPGERKQLVDRLYMKRVRLLAACERHEGQAKRYLALFRHGHLPGEMPTDTGGFEVQAEQKSRDEQQVVRSGMGYSINSVVLPAIQGSNNQPAGLLRSAEQAIREHAKRNPPTVPPGRSTVRELKNRANGWVEDFRREGLRRLKNGYLAGTVQHPGFDSLVGLDFLRREAAEVDLAAKRYAVACLRERVDWDLDEPKPKEELEAAESDSKRLNENDAQEVLNDLEHQAIERAMGFVKREFVRQMHQLKEQLEDFAYAQRLLEENFDSLEREQSRQLERLREQGDPSANQYVLDAEALQIEDGRRMWDFFYEDRISTLSELSLSDKRIQTLLADTVTDLALSRRVSPTTTLQKLFAALREHARRMLATRIGGDPHAMDRERRDGLTLSDALELEVVYRALYRSNAEEIRNHGSDAIRDLVARYNHLPQSDKINLADLKHSDYLRDKIKRLVKEKASLLCVYDGSRDQHGGVRPDHVFLAAIDENFKNSTIEETIQSADSGIHWVTTGWHNPKEIIFYRSVLNVPLYVFGRMEEMKQHYHQFRNLARRPKVLHIDRNWETTLPDLDPDSSQEDYLQKLLRNQVINFATLYTTASTRLEEVTSQDDEGGQPHEFAPRFVVRREGTYYLRDPQPDPDEDLDLHAPDAELGTTLSSAIEKLPQVLEAEKAKYMPYQQLLRGVREGLAPRVLAKICDLPFKWRRNRDALRQRYGSNPDAEQQLKLKDFSDASESLRRALETLYERLHNKSVEQLTLGEDAGFNTAGLTPQQARRNLTQSLQLLAAFCETWKAMEDPDHPSNASVGSFQKLFEEMKKEELDDHLERLKRAGEHNGHKAPRAASSKRKGT